MGGTYRHAGWGVYVGNGWVDIASPRPTRNEVTRPQDGVMVGPHPCSYSTVKLLIPTPLLIPTLHGGGEQEGNAPLVDSRPIVPPPRRESMPRRVVVVVRCWIEHVFYPNVESDLSVRSTQDGSFPLVSPVLQPDRTIGRRHLDQVTTIDPPPPGSQDSSPLSSPPHPY